MQIFAQTGKSMKMQLYYDPSKAADKLWRQAPVFLGLWHPVKMLMQLIWRRFAAWLWAPMMHDLIPGAKFFKKVKTDKLHCFFTYIRLAYPSCRQELQDLEGRDDLPVALAMAAKNLLDICEIYIPLVSCRMLFCYTSCICANVCNR